MVSLHLRETKYSLFRKKGKSQGRDVSADIHKSARVRIGILILWVDILMAEFICAHIN